MVEQGEIIKIKGLGHLAAVISKDSYNESGMAVVCPVVQEKPFSTFEVEIMVDETVLYVASDGLRQLDLESREYTRVARMPYSKLIYVIDKAQSVLDYY